MLIAEDIGRKKHLVRDRFNPGRPLFTPGEVKMQRGLAELASYG